MTFAEYNTDENFNKPSNAMELVRLGKEEGKTREEIEKSLSPLWKEDKKGNVKKALDTYFSTTKETTTPKKETVKTTSNFSKSFMGDQNDLANTIEDSELSRQADKELEIHKANAETYKRMVENFGNIDDKMIAQIPTFMIKRYKNGEFGEPGSTDAKLRLGHFILSNFQSGLKNASNAFSIAGGRGPMFQDTMSDYDKYQQTNLAKGLENRWKKYDAETQAAVDMAVKEGADEQEMRNSIRKVTSSARLNSAFKQMDENQKRNMLYVVSALGDQIGKLDNEDLINTLIGFAVSGENLSWQEAAEVVAAKLGKDGFKSFITGGGKDKLDEVTAGFGGGNSAKSVTLADGTEINPGMTMNDEEFNKITTAADDLSNKYKNGEITEAEYRTEYNKLENVMKSHPMYQAFKNRLTPYEKRKQMVHNDVINELNASYEELNNNAGLASYSDYTEQYNDIIANAKKWGASEKYIKSLEKNRLTESQHAKKVQKAEKKK